MSKEKVVSIPRQMVTCRPDLYHYSSSGGQKVVNLHLVRLTAPQGKMCHRIIFCNLVRINILQFALKYS